MIKITEFLIKKHQQELIDVYIGKRFYGDVCAYIYIDREHKNELDNYIENSYAGYNEMHKHLNSNVCIGIVIGCTNDNCITWNPIISNEDGELYTSGNSVYQKTKEYIIKNDINKDNFKTTFKKLNEKIQKYEDLLK